jgi:hypothetical protein
VKRLKSITDTELGKQFAVMMALVKDRIDPSIISELREDIRAAKASCCHQEPCSYSRSKGYRLGREKQSTGRVDHQ